MSVDKSRPSAKSPVVSFRETSAGRETLAAIAEDRLEIRTPLAHRGPETTKHYGDRISNAPGAVSPKVARALDDAPELTVRMVPAGLQTHVEISRELRLEAPELEVHESDWQDSTDDVNVAALEIEKAHAFVVRVAAHRLRGTRVRQRLIETRLLPTMNGVTRHDILRVTVEAVDDGRSLVTIWTPLHDSSE